MEQIKRCSNILFLVLFSTLIVACATTATGIVSPPITVKAKVKGQDIAVTVYPDGSKPTEVIFDNPEGLVVNLGK